MPNIYRQMLADAVLRNGGYASRDGRWPIEYNVAVYRVDASLKHIYKVTCETHGAQPLPPGPPPFGPFAWGEHEMCEQALEDVRSSLLDGGDCALSTYGPKTAARFGLPHDSFPRRLKRKECEFAYYPARKEGWVIDKPYRNLNFDVKFGLCGRGGKHLVIDEFEGVRLNRVSSQAFYDALVLDEDSGYSNAWCQHLLAMLHEWDQMFTTEHVIAEVEHQMAFRLSCGLETYWKEHDEAQHWAERDVATEGECVC